MWQKVTSHFWTFKKIAQCSYTLVYALNHAWLLAYASYFNGNVENT